MGFRILQKRDYTLNGIFAPMKERLEVEKKRIQAGGQPRMWTGVKHPNKNIDPHICPHFEQTADGVLYGITGDIHFTDWRQFADDGEYSRLNPFGRFIAIGELRVCLK